MSASRTRLWRDLAARQSGMLSRAQLNRLGFTKDTVNTHLRAERWQEVSSTVLSVTTGPLARSQLMWAGVLHAGPDSAIGGLTALEVHGLRNWHRDDVTRTSYGLLSAVVQQHLTDPDRLVDQLGPDASAPPGQGLPARARRDRWRRPHPRRARRQQEVPTPWAASPTSPGTASRLVRTLALHRRRVAPSRGAGRGLEVDGAFHMDVATWADDIERERGLVGAWILVLRCTSTELRDDDSRVVRDLRRVGVGRSSA